MVVFVSVSAAITSLKLINQLGALLVASNHSYLTGFGADASHSLVLLLMDMQHHGYLISQFGWLWLFALGLLGYRSGMFPKWLSVLLMLGTACYVSDALTQFLAPPFANTSGTMFVLPEIVCVVSLLAYLLIKGVRKPPPQLPCSSHPERARLAASLHPREIVMKQQQQQDRHQACPHRVDSGQSVRDLRECQRSSGGLSQQGRLNV